MNEAHDPNRTVDVPSKPSDSLDAGLAAGFGRPADGPSSVLTELRSRLGPLQPVLLGEVEDENAHTVQPKSDAMPAAEDTSDRYQLFGEIARGGMGAVLRGRDVDLGRDLAVKVLLEKHADRPEVARRFIEEAQIGGQLQHPGVVPVYDVGRFGDRPFFTMKLVKGQTLAAILGERSDPSQERSRLLSIALQVCQALAYAHAKGVIHRDLKPANIMVGAFGEVQVMDWGLAKVLLEGGVADEKRASRQHQPEEGSLIRTARSTGSAGTFGTVTEAGSLLGTPAYMPPEQANGDVSLLDRRADVFGLGAILCEVLTGKPPYVGRSAEEVRRKAANGDLTECLTRLDGCGADPELIALTKACLAPEAIDRPRDAHAVADALTAYQGGVQERLHQAELARAAEVARTEEAQATAAQERKARQAAQARAVAERRARRLTLALAATMLLCVALGGGGFLWLKNEREARLAQVNREVHDALTQARAFRATDLSAAREQSQRALALVRNGPADEALAAQVEQLRAELDAQEKDRQLVLALDQARLERAGAVVGELQFSKERLIAKFRAAFQAYGMEAGKGEPVAAADRIRQRPAAVREAIVAALDEWDELAEGAKPGTTEPHRDWLRAVLEAAEPADAWNRQVRLARRETDPARRRAALVALATSADVEKTPASSLTRLADQLPQNPAAVELLRRAAQRYPADFWVNCGLGTELVIRRSPDWDEAVRFLTVAVALRPNNSVVHVNLGYALARQGKGEEAIACFRKALAIDPKYALIHHNLGASQGLMGKVDEALACYRKAIELDPKLAVSHLGLGGALRDRGQLDEAIACCRKAVDLAPRSARAHTGLGNALKDKGQVDEAIACFHKAIALDPSDAEAHSSLGNALQGKGKGGGGHRLLPQGHRSQPEVRCGPLQPGPGPCEAGPGGGGHRQLPEGHSPRPEARRGPLQPGQCAQAQGPGGRGYRQLQEGPRTRPQLRRGPLQPGRRLARAGSILRVPVGIQARP
jgi:serine/threonine-protein kinase